MQFLTAKDATYGFGRSVDLAHAEPRQWGIRVNRIGFSPGGYGVFVWASICGTLAAVVYVFLSPYARDLFRQFPERQTEETKK
jgi:heme exporter protein D